jgi:hypothetical protein
MSDGLEALSRVGIEAVVPAARLARPRRDEGGGQGKREQPQDGADRAQEPDVEDDGLVHVDVRA